MTAPAMSWKIDLARNAHKTLKRAPTADRYRLLAALDMMKVDPFSGDVQWLDSSPPPLVRRRVGSWRILFRIDVEEKVVRVTSILRGISTTNRKRQRS